MAYVFFGQILPGPMMPRLFSEFGLTRKSVFLYSPNAGRQSTYRNRRRTGRVTKNSFF